MRSEVIRRLRLFRFWWNNLSERERRDRITVAMEVIIASATTIYAIISLLQWRAIGESNRINREALMSVQRAFVNLKTIEIAAAQNTQGEHIGWSFVPQWENSGSTPTKVLRQHSNCIPRTEPLSESFDFPDFGPDKNQDSLIAPKATISSHILPPVPSGILVEVQKRKLRFYLWGWAAYRDVFQKSKVHLTEFCYELTSVTGDVMTGTSLGTLYMACPFHNCADEYCKDYADTEKKLEGN